MVTKYNARTFLQTQLNKAVRVSELQTSKLTNRNPKDLIIYPESDFVFMDHSLQRDNNGRGFFDDRAPYALLTRHSQALRLFAAHISSASTSRRWRAAWTVGVLCFTT